MDSTTAQFIMPTYIPIDFSENLGRYQLGGYHPVMLGDRLRGDRYTILSKLGHGGYSTVWLARDTPSNRFVTVKILVAEDCNGANERTIRDQLSRASKKHRGLKCIQQLLDAFSVTGPNGTHTCLVSEPCGYSIQDSKSHPCQSAWIFPLEVARAIAAQMILATDFVHSQGIAHGDLHMGNFLLRIPFDLDALTVEQYEARYPSETVAVRRYDKAPLSASIPPLVTLDHGIGKPCSLLTLVDVGVMLTDFGTSWRAAKTAVYHLCTPKAYLPPEALFSQRLNRPLSFGADIWSLAVSLFNVFSRRSLLPGECRDEHDAFAKHYHLLGERPPQVWMDAWTARSKFFDAAGQWAPRGYRSRNPCGNLAARLQVLRTDRKEFDDRAGVVLSDAEYSALGEMIGSMLKWDPNARVSAKKLKKDVWMEKWGLPAKRAVDAARSAAGVA